MRSFAHLAGDLLDIEHDELGRPERREAHGGVDDAAVLAIAYENALAERVIGTLKNEYALDDLFVDCQHALTPVKEAIWLYNYERPHLSLAYRKPAQVHLASVPKVRAKTTAPS